MKRLSISILMVTLLASLSGCNSDSYSNIVPVNNVNNSASNTTPVNNESSNTIPVNNEVSNTKPVDNGTNLSSNTTLENTGNNYTTDKNDAFQEKNIFYGEWIVKGAIAYGQSVELGKQDIKQLVGQRLSYNSDSASFEGNVLKNPYYRAQDITEQEFFSSNYVGFQQLGISGKSIVEINVYTANNSNNTWDNPASQTFIKDRNTLIMIMGGVYFELVKK